MADKYLEYRDTDFRPIKIDMENLNTKARRHLKAEDLVKLYTEEELASILGKKPDPSDKWLGQLMLLKQESKTRTSRHHRRWSHIEDKFLKDTYGYLADTEIALALNIPVAEVRRHRAALKLFKDYSIDSFYLVWCNRENYEDDMKKYKLTKLRGDGVHPLLPRKDK